MSKFIESSLDVCARIQCGPNADCFAFHHIGSCKCRSGYEGDANELSIGCRPTSVACSSSAECGLNTYCYESICRRKFFLFIRLVIFSNKKKLFLMLTISILSI